MWPAGWRAPKQSLLQGIILENCFTVTHIYAVLADYNVWDTDLKKKNSKLSVGRYGPLYSPTKNSSATLHPKYEI